MKRGFVFILLLVLLFACSGPTAQPEAQATTEAPATTTASTQAVEEKAPEPKSNRDVEIPTTLAPLDPVTEFIERCGSDAEALLSDNFPEAVPINIV